MNILNIGRSMARLLAALVFATSATAYAGNLYWDGGSTDILTTGNGASGGTGGTWDTTILNWDQGALDHVNWTNANNDTAVFGGTAGTVTVASAVSVSGLVFSTANYILTNGVVTFGVDGSISNSVTATIWSSLAGSAAITKSGVGTLILSGTNSFNGGLIINQGGVNMGVAAVDSLGAAGGTVTVNATTTLNYGGNTIFQKSFVLNNNAMLNHVNGNNAGTITGAVTGNGGVGPQNAGGLEQRTLSLTSTSNTFTGPITLNWDSGNNATISVNSLADDPGAGAINLFANASGEFIWGAGAITPLVLSNRQFVISSTTANGNLVIKNNNTNSLTIIKSLSVITNGNKTLILDGVASPTNVFAGNITNGVSAVVSLKVNSSSWTLVGTNTYSGDTLVNGTPTMRGAAAVSPNTKFRLGGDSGSAGNGNSIRILVDDSGTVNLGNQLDLRSVQTSATATWGVYVANNGGATIGSTISLGLLNFAYTTDGRANGLKFNVNGANGYRVQISGADLNYLDANGNWLVPQTASLLATGTLKQTNGKLSTHPWKSDYLFLDGTTNANVISGTIMDAGDYTDLSNTNARPLNVIKSSTSVWSLSGTNTYTGWTYANGGTLIVNSLANGGLGSSIGQSSNLTVGLVLGGGTFQYAPIDGVGAAGHSSDRIFTITSSSTLDASGTGALAFNNTGIISPDVAGLGGQWAGASAVISNLTSTASLAIGMRVSGTGIPAGRTIASIDSDTRVTLSSGTSVTAGSGDVAFGYTARTLTLAGSSTDSNTIAGVLQDSSAAGAQALSVTKNGAGTWILSGTNTYSGVTTVTAGTLRVNGSLGAGAVNVVGGTLGGNGTIGGTVTNKATVAPGASAGILTINGDYKQATNGTLNIEIGGAIAGTNYDQLVVNGSATIAGTLNVTFTNGYTGVANDSFTVLQNSLLFGAFATTNLPALGGGNGWNVEYLAGGVVLSITNAGGPPPSTGYDLYAEGITNGVTDYQGDGDGDGYANLLEYVTGGDANNADANAAMSGTRVGGLLALQFTRTSNSVDATLIVEGSNASTNDANWIGIATNIGGSWGSATNVVETNGPSIFNVTAYDTSPSTNRFLRLRVTRP